MAVRFWPDRRRLEFWGDVIALVLAGGVSVVSLILPSDTDWLVKLIATVLFFALAVLFLVINHRLRVQRDAELKGVLRDVVVEAMAEAITKSGGTARRVGGKVVAQIGKAEEVVLNPDSLVHKHFLDFTTLTTYRKEHPIQSRERDH